MTGRATVPMRPRERLQRNCKSDGVNKLHRSPPFIAVVEGSLRQVKTILRLSSKARYSGVWLIPEPSRLGLPPGSPWEPDGGVWARQAGRKSLGFRAIQVCPKDRLPFTGKLLMRQTACAWRFLPGMIGGGTRGRELPCLA